MIEEYDLFVIGGGSGGLSCVKSAALIDPSLKIGICDFVKPSALNNKWGLGGTCVNVGCIPKKLMHHASKMGEIRHDQIEMGWDIDLKKQHNWNIMVENVQNHIKLLNYSYRFVLQKDKTQYYNMLGKIIDKNTVQLSDINGINKIIKAKHIVIAVGGRPQIPDNINKQLVLTSDDIFSMKKAPGKTLVVGASYVALECAGFIKGCGYDTTVMVRSILLRGFDQQMANKVGEYMQKTSKIKFIYNSTVSSVELTTHGTKLVKYSNHQGEIGEEEFDSVLFATGREIDTDNIVDGSLQMDFNCMNKKIKTDKYEMSNIQDIYCIGDCAQDRPELTPPAIKAGQILAQNIINKLKGEEQNNIIMDYKLVATTVFTPLEYSACGLSEEDSIKEYGEEDIEVYHGNFKPLEWVYDQDSSPDQCYTKVITLISRNHQIVGLHYLGPNAGEVIQGYAVAIKMNATWKDFKQTVGIHPTCAEEILGLNVTKRSGQDPNKEGC